MLSLKDTTTGNSLDLELLERNDLLSELSILSLKLVEFLLTLGVLLSILLTEHGDVLNEDLLDLELLHLVIKGSFFLLNNALLGVEVVDEFILLIHLFFLAHDLILKSFNLVEIVSEVLDFVLQLHVLLLHLKDVSSHTVDSCIGVESILEEAWSSNLLVGSLVDEIVWNNTLSDHLSFHDNVFIVIKIISLNLLSDFVKFFIGWISSVGVLEIVDPVDVLALLLISQGLESLECLQVNWFIVAIIILRLLRCLLKELVQFLLKKYDKHTIAYILKRSKHIENV